MIKQTLTWKVEVISTMKQTQVGNSLGYLLFQVNPQIVGIGMDQFLFKDVQMDRFADLPICRNCGKGR
jgi:hypothetical protein